MTDSLTNPTPKARFMESPDNCSKHRVLVDSKEFQRAVDFALMQYQIRLSVTGGESQTEVMANGYKMRGAVEFISELRMLSELPRPVAPQPKADNLIHTLS